VRELEFSLVRDTLCATRRENSRVLSCEFSLVRLPELRRVRELEFSLVRDTLCATRRENWRVSLLSENLRVKTRVSQQREQLYARQKERTGVSLSCMLDNRTRTHELSRERKTRETSFASLSLSVECKTTEKE